VFVPGKSFHPSLKFVGEAGAYPSEAPGLTHKQYSRLKSLARDKHSSLLRKSVNYGRKKFYSTGPLRQEKYV